jgi:hypothetical protein
MAKSHAVLAAFLWLACVTPLKAETVSGQARVIDGDTISIDGVNVRLHGIDPKTWLTDTLDRIADHKIGKLDELMPWRYAES